MDVFTLSLSLFLMRGKKDIFSAHCGQQIILLHILALESDGFVFPCGLRKWRYAGGGEGAIETRKPAKWL